MLMSPILSGATAAMSCFPRNRAADSGHASLDVADNRRQGKRDRCIQVQCFLSFRGDEAVRWTIAGHLIHGGAITLAGLDQLN